MRIASFFSGVGGLELGLEAALGAETVFQCERDPYAVSVLERHWPGVKLHGDITTLRPDDIPQADIWCGGFPCTDLSHAKSGREGLHGKQSGLWFSWLRLIRERRPRCIVVENVYSAWREWVPVVRLALHALGYSSVPVRVRAADVGAPHCRARAFVMAYADSSGLEVRPGVGCNALEEQPASWRSLSGPDGVSAAAEYGRGADGLADRVARIQCAGRAVVPQCAYVVGLRLRQIMNELTRRERHEQAR